MKGFWSIRRAMAALLSSLLLSTIFAGRVESKKIRIDPMTHSVGSVSKENFDAKVSRFRSENVFVIFYYSQRQKCDDCKSLIDNEFNDFAKKMKGIIEVFAADCDENEKLCKNQNVSEYPSVMIYPTLPMPPFPFKNKVSVANLTNAIRSLLPDNTTIVHNDDAHGKLMKMNDQVPKVLIFTDKAKMPPLLVKALSNAFKDKLFIGFVNSELGKSVVAKYSVSSFPHVRLMRKSKKDEVYTGKFEFQELFDWLNVFSETFVIGGGFSDAKGDSSAEQESRPWKFESLPELTKLSYIDICFKKTSKSLCVIFVKDGHKDGNQLLEKEKKMLEDLKAKYEKKLEGKELDFRFMWMDVDTEKEFKQFFALTDLPGLIVFNPHKKMRWTKVEGQTVSEESISNLLDKIASGDARFKIVPGQKLPAWANRKLPEAKKSKKDEL